MSEEEEKGVEERKRKRKKERGHERKHTTSNRRWGITAAMRAPKKEGF